MSRAEIWILGAGAVTPVGCSAAASAAAVRAGISRLGEHPFLVDEAGEPLLVAGCSHLGDHLPVAERLDDLAAAAAHEALRPLKQVAVPLPPLALLLGLPSPRPGLPADLEHALPARLAAGLPAQLKPAAAQVHALDHAAGFIALEQAVALLAQGSVGLCLVGGVDSQLTPDRLRQLLAQGGLLNDKNPWGFVPGEGAGFLLLAPSPVARQLGLSPWARVASVATAREPNPWPRGVSTGEGLSRCFRQVLSMLPDGAKVNQLVGDFNGQPYRAEELGYALARSAPWIQAADRSMAPATSWGDQGAASGPLLISLALQAGLRGWAPGPRALCWSSSDSGQRGAVLLELSDRPMDDGSSRS